MLGGLVTIGEFRPKCMMVGPCACMGSVGFVHSYTGRALFYAMLSLPLWPLENWCAITRRSHSALARRTARRLWPWPWPRACG